MIISFSGAQSTGKTTLLKHLQAKNKDIVFVPEVTRLVKRQYNLPINEDGTDLTQKIICAEHLKNAYSVDHQKANVILDRCSLDGWVYSSWLYKKKKISASTLSFSEETFHDTQAKYDAIFYTSPDDLVVEDDGERSIDIDFRNDIIKLFDLLKTQYTGNLITLRGTVEERLQAIQNTLKNITNGYTIII